MDKFESIQLNTNQSSINDKSFNQIQYIQNKAFELNYLNGVSDCFKFIQGIVKELFTYDKFAVLQYSQGQTVKLYDVQKNNNTSIN